ncbi:DMT family transporter [Albibacillus kandeliae]|uniref:DMT family transporter n=1 Tax=Albibacillus kandeliae TaxID=2174228 RepID=UPI000D69250A|nr:DMT family transporter [Albibacillus kandeliae]
MTRREIAFFTGVLVLLGMGWGLTQPLTKVAVSTGYQPFGLIFWQLAIGAIVLSVVAVIRRRRLTLTLPALKVYLAIALLGTLLPNAASYKAIAHLPSGVVSVLISLVPMMSFPMALALGLERFSPRRLLGLSAGLGGVMLLVLPDASLPDVAMLAWVPMGLVAPLLYACEGNYVARWGTAGLDAVEVLHGASLLGAAIALPLALGTGQFITPLQSYGPAELALVLASLVHVGVYCVYVWLVGRTGPVFALQVGYSVTAFGVLWALLLLQETYSPYFWAAMGLILFGVLLVQPRRNEAVAEVPPIGETGV